MHIVCDAREAFSEQKSGKGQWTSGLLSELRSRDVRMTLLSDRPMFEEGVVTLPSGIRWHGAAAEYIRSRSDIDCYISPTSFIVPYLLKSTLPCVQVIHDLIAFRGEPHDRKATMLERLFLPRITKKVSVFCAVSEATKNDLLDRFPGISGKRVHVVYAGPMRSQPPMNVSDGKTILCVATLCPRKNQLRLMQAFASLPSPLREEYRLVLAGNRGWQDASIVRMAANTKGVEWVGYASNQAYETLLGTCAVFALPSLYEGFGMQILDALQRGVPVLTSDRGSLKEVAGNAAVLVDPESERSIESGLVAILENADVRRELRARGPSQAAQFSWKRTADLVLAAAEEAVYLRHGPV